MRMLTQLEISIISGGSIWDLYYLASFSATCLASAYLGKAVAINHLQTSIDANVLSASGVQLAGSYVGAAVGGYIFNQYWISFNEIDTTKKLQEFTSKYLV